MVRAWAVVLGIGLVLMGLSGLGSMGGTWMPWADFALAAGSFAVALTDKAAGTSLIAIGLFIVWIVGLNSGTANTGLAWWNFVFGCIYTLVTIAGSQLRGAKQVPPKRADESRIDRTNRAA